MKLKTIINFVLITSPVLGLENEEDNSQLSLKIKTNWHQTSPSLELLELLALDSTSAYYSSLNLIFNNIIKETEKSSKKVFENTLKILKKELKLKNFDLLNFGLSLKVSSSKLETKVKYFENYIKEKIIKFEICNNWLQVNNLQFCNIEEFENWLNSNELDNIENERLLPFDMIYPKKDSHSNQLTIFYYTNFHTGSFEFYTKLVDFINSHPKINFALRYQPAFDNDKVNGDKVELAGYGVYLDLKSTEYKVQDDRYQNKNSKDNKSTGEGSETDKIPVEYKNIWNEELKGFQSNIQPIKKYEDSDLEGFNQKFTQLIQGTKSPLETWVYLLQNLPHHAETVNNATLKDGHCDGITMGRNFFFQQPIQDQILVNGVEIDLSQLDIFNFYKFLNLEFNTFKLFNDLTLTNEEALNLLIGKSEGVEEEEMQSSAEAKSIWEDVFDTRDDKEGEHSKVVIWLNNIEKDELYADWSTELSSLQTYMYGYLPQTKRNFANSIFPLNLNELSDLETFASKLLQFSSNPVPVRFGLVTLLDDNNEDSKKIVNLVHYLFDKLSTSELSEYFKSVLESVSEKEATIIDSFTEHYSSLKKNNSELELELEEILKIKNSEYIEPTLKYSNRLQLNNNSEDLLFINGKRISYEGNFQKPLIQNLFKQIPIIMEMSSEGHLESDTNIYEYWLNQPQVLTSYNPLLNEERFDNLNLISWIQPNDNSPLNQFKFILSKTNDGEPFTTIWIIGNIDNQFSLIIDTIKYLKSNANIRLSFVPTNLKSKTTKFLFNLISNPDQLEDLPETLEDLESFEFKQTSKQSELETYFNQINSYFDQFSDSNLSDGGDGIQLVLDTKVLKVTSKESNFIQFKPIIEYYKSKFQNELVKKIEFNLKKLSILNQVDKSNLLIQIQSILNHNLEIHQSLVRFGTFDGDRGTLPDIQRPQCQLKFKENEESSSVWANIEFVLDPLGENAAKWSAILSTIQHFEGVQLKGFLSPNSAASEFKKTHLNRFYRYLLPTKLDFNETNNKLKSPKIEFSDLPQTALLTLGLDTVTSWVVTASDSPHDLDNLKFSSLPASGTHPEFELKHLLIEGHCTDFDRRPPRGLEFNLGNNNNPNIADTIVMANLGYFQFKANPGVWQMRIRPGKSNDVYEIVNIGDQGHAKSGRYIDERRTLVLDSLSGITLFPKVKKKKGMEDVDLLEVKEEEKPKKPSMWNSIFGSSKPSSPASNDDNPHGDINVFTVASGHLYERFLSVMVASVMNNTDRKVKFWFIENFLSPSFKKFIPKLSQRYNFTYQMVTYQWPHWLNVPSEKQRIIWGYKILFLDVLFPLDLDKVIFVDADQSVRADLGELVDLDLEGKPYGYTPFCTSRESMKGYRFWEQGYWKSHLDGKPYHISALYVVDLKRFRSQAAGDILRQHYQMLSQDPNSLANLDQDLPNHLQHELPIFSLPQEWLWCETWCDDASLKTAKTIDLCNNPETKEPKLDRARRILPEWQVFDEEVHSIDDDTTIEEPKESKSESSEDEEL